MNSLAILLMTLLLTCKMQSSYQKASHKSNLSDTINQVTRNLQDTTIQKIQSGFYLAISDSSKTQGFKLYNKDDYYFLGTTPAVTMAQVDTVYKDFNTNFNGHILIFKFNDEATKNWFDFTQKYLGMKVGLVADDKLIYVATIVSSISGGVSSLAGSYSEKEIDDFLVIFEKEIKTAKQSK